MVLLYPSVSVKSILPVVRIIDKGLRICKKGDHAGLPLLTLAVKAKEPAQTGSFYTLIVVIQNHTVNANNKQLS